MLSNPLQALEQLTLPSRPTSRPLAHISPPLLTTGGYSGRKSGFENGVEVTRRGKVIWSVTADDFKGSRS